MLRNYLKVALRNLLKHRLATSINILGLTLGMATLLFILIYVQHEKKYDRWFAGHQELYRVYKSWANNKGSAITPSPLAASLRQEIPAAQAATQLTNWGEMAVTNQQQKFLLKAAHVIDSSFFEVIPYPFLYGSPASAVSNLESAILPYATYQKLFTAGQNPIGETLTLDGEHQVQITGVLAPPQGSTHFNFDLLIYLSFPQSSWSGGNGFTYLKINPQATPSELEQTIYHVASKYLKQEAKEDNIVFDPQKAPIWRLQPLTAIHLGSTHLGEKSASRGNIRKIRLYIFLGLFVLSLAVINYINLSLAQSVKRSKEIGVRKMNGAHTRHIANQFLFEVFIQCLIALGLAITLVELGLPFFNNIVTRELTFLTDITPIHYVSLFGIVIFVTFLAGFYPAVFLSRLKPMLSMKGIFKTSRKGHLIRKGLVVLQFSVSIALITVMTFILQQIRYINNKDLGFQKENVILLDLNSESAVDRINSTITQLKELPGVQNISRIARTPGRFIPNYKFNLQNEQESSDYISTFFTDQQFSDVLNLEVLQGRFFSEEFRTDTLSAFVVNQSFIDQYGINNPIGMPIKFSFDNSYGQIVGVINDFHYTGLQQKIDPLVLSARKTTTWMGTLAVKVAPHTTTTFLNALERQWATIEPNDPLDYSFLSDELSQQYLTHQQESQLISYVTFLSILIALLGLFGLVTFNAEKRLKEIGIRKVLGASEYNLTVTLIRQFLLLILIAACIAIPLGIYFSEQWLQNFAYRIDISLMSIITILISIFTLALLTVGFKAFYTARLNPAEVVRNE